MHIPEYVVYQTGEGSCSLGTGDSDASDKRAVHGSLYETEDVLHAAPDLGLLAVVLPLLVCQGMVTTALLADDRYHAALPDLILLRLVAGIEIQGLVPVFLLDEGLDDVGVMDTGIRGDVLLNEFF